MKMYYFPIVASLIFLFMNLYVLKSLQNRFIKERNFLFLKPIFWLIFALLTMLEILYFFSLRFNYLDGILYQISVATIAVTFMLFAICILFDLISFFTSKIKFSEKRRKFAKFSIDSAFVAASTLYVGTGFYNGLKKPAVKEVEIKLKNLPNELNLAMIADVHLGEFLNKDFLEFIIDKVNTLDTKALLIVGDMLDLKSYELKDVLEPLKKLKIPAFFTLGNHEYYNGANELMQALRSYGVRVLANENVKFEGINLAGVNDISGFKFGYLEPDLKKALSGKDESLPTVLMSHQPKYVVQNVKDEIDLALCGHTHGGQIFPFSFLVRLDQTYVAGLYNDGVKQIYVSSGTGFWGPQARVFAPSEITLLKLKRG
ncbi:acyl carrier protein [Campylobacter geochelonis]|nr:acyl carrier protein [Campylobacter geochelonis]